MTNDTETFSRSFVVIDISKACTHHKILEIIRDTWRDENNYVIIIFFLYFKFEHIIQTRTINYIITEIFCRFLLRIDLVMDKVRY